MRGMVVVAGPDGSGNQPWSAPSEKRSLGRAARFATSTSGNEYLTGQRCGGGELSPILPPTSVLMPPVSSPRSSLFSRRRSSTWISPRAPSSGRCSRGADSRFSSRDIAMTSSSIRLGWVSPALRYVPERHSSAVFRNLEQCCCVRSTRNSRSPGRASWPSRRYAANMRGGGGPAFFPMAFRSSASTRPRPSTSAC